VEFLRLVVAIGLLLACVASGGCASASEADLDFPADLEFLRVSINKYA